MSDSNISLKSIFGKFFRNPDASEVGFTGTLPVEVFSSLQVSGDVLANLATHSEELISNSSEKVPVLNKIINSVSDVLTDYILYCGGTNGSIPNNSRMTLRGKVSSFVRREAKSGLNRKLTIEIEAPGVPKKKFLFDDVSKALALLLIEVGALQSRLTVDPEFQGPFFLTVPTLIPPLEEEESGAEEEKSEREEDAGIQEARKRDKTPLRCQLDTLAINLSQYIVNLPHWGNLTMRERSILMTRVVTCLGLSTIMPSGHDKRVSRNPRSPVPNKAPKQVAKKPLSKEEKELEEVRKEIKLEKERIHGELPHGHPLLLKYRSILDRIRSAKVK